MASLSLEWRPTEDLHFYFDSIFGRIFNDLDRSDMDWGVRAGAGAQAADSGKCRARSGFGRLSGVVA